MYILVEKQSDDTLKVIDHEIKSIEEAESRVTYSDKFDNKTLLLIPVAASIKVKISDFGHTIKAETTKY